MKKTYALVGYPLGHSFSKVFFTDKFKREELSAEYLNFELSSLDNLKSEIENHPHLIGFNVTIPYKQQIIPMLNSMSKEAKEIGAVNVVRIMKGKAGTELKGYNSDVIGFSKSIKPLLKSYHKKALVLGTGGASRAVFYGLKHLGLLTQYVSRTKKNGILSYEELNEELIKDFTVIVNCTPLGMSPKTDKCPSIPYKFIGSKHLLFDLIYNPDETLFLKKGKIQGATTKNGLEMLHLQALESWDIWNKNKI